MNHRKLAERIARAIFRAPYGCEPDKTQRIQLMGGTWPNTETNLGGLCEQSLVDLIEHELAQSEEAPNG